MSDKRDPPLCPSAPPEWPDAVLFGVVNAVDGDPEVAYLDRTVPVDGDLIESTAPVDPGEVLRIAAPCASGNCAHFGGGRCGLAKNVITLLPTVTAALPVCAIRARCVWFKQEGRAACLRCPQVVTNQPTADPILHRVVETDSLHSR